jgi:hypothetical protein
MLNPKQFDPGKNPKQLRMFMTASEIKGLVNTSKDIQGSETMDDMWKRKVGESKNRDNLYDNLIRDGYKGTPVPISHEDYTDHGGTKNEDIRLIDGHHRVASMEHIDPKAYIPVVHSTWSREGYYADKAKRIQAKLPPTQFDTSDYDSSAL